MGKWLDLVWVELMLKVVMTVGLTALLTAEKRLMDQKTAATKADC